jgi:hypothetical protein
MRTAELYRGLLRNHIQLWIGHLDLADVVPPTIRRWRRRLRDHGVSEGVTAKAYRLLHAVLATAVDDGSIRTNPCNIKGAGQHESDERMVATLEQVCAWPRPFSPATGWWCCSRHSRACATARSWGYAEMTSHSHIER